MSKSINIIKWRDYTIEISYEPNWLNSSEYGNQMAHIEVRTIEPKDAPLPITGTGYRSHFTHPDALKPYNNDAVQAVTTWLDEEAKSPEWIQYEEAQQQMCLF